MPSFLVRPPVILVGGLYVLLGFFFLSFLVNYPPSSLNGTQRKSATYSEVSTVWKSMSIIWGIPFPYKSGAQNHVFRRLRNSPANLTAYISEMKHDIIITQVRWQLHGVSYTSSHNGRNFGSQTVWNLIFTPLCKLCFLLHCHASQTEISKRNSTKLCQTVDGKSQ